MIGEIQKAISFATKKQNHRNFFVGAVGYRADGVLVHATNEAAKIRTPSVHAEARLCRKLGRYAPLIIVARYSVGTGEWGMAKPCETCQSILRSYKVKKVIYTTGPNSFEMMEL